MPADPMPRPSPGRTGDPAVGSDVDKCPKLPGSRLQSFLRHTPDRELEADAHRITVLITTFDSSDDMWRCGGDEVVENLHHCGRGLDVREVPDAGEHFKPATRHGGVSGVAVGDRDDPVLVPPNQQGG